METLSANPGFRTPRIIAFDIYFQKDTEKPVDENDILFAKQMKAGGNVVLPIYFNLNKQELVGSDAVSTDAFTFPQTANMEALDPFKTVKAYDLLTSAEELNQAAFGVGHINMIPDNDVISLDWFSFVNVFQFLPINNMVAAPFSQEK